MAASPAPCASCGASNPAWARFCGGCGAAVAGGPDGRRGPAGARGGGGPAADDPRDGPAPGPDGHDPSGQPGGRAARPVSRAGTLTAVLAAVVVATAVVGAGLGRGGSTSGTGSSPAGGIALPTDLPGSPGTASTPRPGPDRPAPPWPADFEPVLDRGSDPGSPPPGCWSTDDQRPCVREVVGFGSAVPDDTRVRLTAVGRGAAGVLVSALTMDGSGAVYALDLDGAGPTLRWGQRLPHRVSSPARAAGGHVLVVDDGAREHGSTVQALRRGDGALVWTRRLDVRVSGIPPAATDTHLAVAGPRIDSSWIPAAPGLRVLRGADGALVDDIAQTGPPVSLTAAPGPGLLLTSNRDELEVVGPGRGTRWSGPAGHVARADGVVFTAGLDDVLTARGTTTGDLRWRADPEAGLPRPPVAGDGLVMVLDDRSVLRAFDRATGDPAGQVGLDPTGGLGWPAAVLDGVAYLPTISGVLAVDPVTGHTARFDPDGTLHGGAVTDVAVLPGGAGLLATVDDRLYVLEPAAM